MQRAIELASNAAREGEVPIGAVLVHENRILAEGLNQREALLRTSAHAEMLALEEFNDEARTWRLPAGTSLYTTLEPCTMCTGALLWARLENIYFAAADPKNAGLLRIIPLIEQGIYDHRFKIVQGGLLEEASQKLLRDFFSVRRN